MRKLKININIDFCYNLQNKPGINLFIIEFYNLNNYTNLQFDRYLNKKNNQFFLKFDNTLNNPLSINSYLGNDLTEKIRHFFSFFKTEISQFPIKDILEGTYWTDEFHFNILEDYK